LVFGLDACRTHFRCHLRSPKGESVSPTLF
jgi:hypothetical protein